MHIASVWGAKNTPESGRKVAYGYLPVGGIEHIMTFCQPQRNETWFTEQACSIHFMNLTSLECYLDECPFGALSQVDPCPQLTTWSSATQDFEVQTDFL